LIEANPHPTKLTSIGPPGGNLTRFLPVKG